MKFYEFVYDGGRKRVYTTSKQALIDFGYRCNRVRELRGETLVTIWKERGLNEGIMSAFLQPEDLQETEPA